MRSVSKIFGVQYNEKMGNSKGELSPKPICGSNEGKFIRVISTSNIQIDFK